MKNITQADFHLLDYWAMAGYFVLVTGLGLFFAYREKNAKDTEEYFLGGRKIPSFLIAVSMYVALFSAISFVAIPAEAFEHGLSLFLNQLVAPIGIILGFTFFVKFYFTSRSFTPFEYLERRYNGSVRLFISVVYLLMRLLYLGVVMYATAKAFKGAAGWPIYATILIVGLVSIVYTTLGGMKAIVWIDLLQFSVIVIGIGGVLFVLGKGVDGGWPEIFKYSFANGRGFEAQKDLHAFFSFNPYERFTFWLLILGMVGLYTFTYGSDQMVVQKLLSAPSYKHAFKANLTNAAISLPVGSMFWLIGLGLYTFYNLSKVSILPPAVHPGEVFSYFIVTELPTPMPGLLMVALLSATLSTIASGMNSLSAVFVKDVYKRIICPSVSLENEVSVSKIVTMTWGIFFISFALVISFLSESIISSVLEIAGLWGSLLGVAAGTFLLGVTNKRAHAGVVFVSAGIGIVGFVFFVWKFYYGCPPDERISFNITGAIPLLSMIFIGYPLSYLWPNPKNDKFVKGLTLTTYKDKLLQENI